MMRFIFLFLFLLPIAAKAQFEQVDYGITGGVNVSNLNGDFAFGDAKNRASFYLGGFVEMPITGALGVRSELFYSAVGAKTEFLTVDTNWSFSYINIPVMAQYEVSEGLNLMSGFQVGVLLSAKNKLESSNSDLVTKITDEYKTIDFSWVIGAAYRFEMGLGVNVRYNLGLTDIVDQGFGEAKNRVFQIGATYLLSAFLNK